MNSVPYSVQRFSGASLGSNVQRNNLHVTNKKLHISHIHL